ncbi:hypothetical protein N7495_006771 [Penicillium taxi]|uniref:uncharacterized protein n=1 Tax=Penicillium taxi TaxID=168475 RepID=UPI00254533BB|nr:uncharacterized protein N7495_006771 [Penicillium taxi]KAJ5895080.1 hypothetical protein N7495_006771 [Penicillium taxi]
MRSRETQPVRKRRRPALSCQQCRAKKIRCDRGFPCRPCIKVQSSSMCSYVDEGKVLLDARLESMGPSTATDNDHESPSSGQDQRIVAGQTPDIDRIMQLERTVSALQGQVQDLQQRIDSGDVRRLGNESIRDGKRPARSGQSEQPPTLIPPLELRLKSFGEKTKLFGTTHWAMVFQQFHLLRQARGTASCTDGNQDEVGERIREIRGLRNRIKKKNLQFLTDPAPDLLNEIPSREICDDLVQYYLRTLGFMYRVIHVPTFYQEYESFWKTPTSASKGFIMKLLLILAIGSVFYCNPGPVNELGLPIYLWIHAVQCWLSGSSQKETMNLTGLQVHCLLIICRQAYAIEKDSSWISAGTLLRLAIRQGFHRDPSHFPSLSFFECEMRRRIWAVVLELNVTLSIDVAMPPLLSSDDFDTSPPSNLDDEDFHPLSSTISSHPKSSLTDSSLQILLLRSFAIRLQITRTINECGHEHSFENALKLGNELNISCKEIAAFFQKYPACSSDSRPRPTQLHYHLMDTLLRRFLIYLYRPFAIQASRDPRLYLARKLSLDSALIIFSYGDSPTDAPATDLTSYQDFYRLALSGAGFFKCHLSQDVLITICLELITQFEEEAATQPTGSSQLTDAMNKVAQAARAPLIQALERIRNQLYQSLAAGIPSMKRYCILGGVLAQIQCVPHGDQGDWTHIREALIESMQTCRTLLQQHITKTSQFSPDDGKTLVTPGNQWMPDSDIASSLDSGVAFPGLGFGDLDFWDIPDMIDTIAFDSDQIL